MPTPADPPTIGDVHDRHRATLAEGAAEITRLEIELAAAKAALRLHISAASDAKMTGDQITEAAGFPNRGRLLYFRDHAKDEYTFGSE